MLMVISMAIDDNGQILSLDLLLYVLVLAVVFLLASYIYLSFEDSSSDMITDSVNDYRLDLLVDTLFKTPGYPYNWDLLSVGDVEAIGLSVNNSSYLISYDKLLKLKNNPDLIYTIFPSQFKCNIVLVSGDYPSQSINIIKRYTPTSNDDVLTRRVPIIIDYGYNISHIDSNKDNYNCPYNHSNGEDYWRCKSFNISRQLLGENRCYVLSTNSNIILSNTYGENVSMHSKDYIDITDTLMGLIHQDEDTIYVHIHSHDDDNYFVCDKNNRAQHLNSIRTPEKYTAVVEVST